MTEHDKPIIAIIGGALTGSAAAALAARRGARVVVIEQADEPYGVMFERLPSWHFDERDAQISVVNENLETPGVSLVASTALGRDVTVDELLGLGVQRILTARGTVDLTAPTGSGGAIDDRTLLHWFNRRGRHDYRGPRLAPPADAIVVGTGLAAIDCARALVFLRVIAAVETFGRQTGNVPLHRLGVRQEVARHGATVEGLGLGTTKLYVPSLAALLPGWVDADTRAAVLARLAEDLVEVVVGAPPDGVGMVVTVSEPPRLQAMEARPEVVDLAPSVPDLMMLERHSPEHAALQLQLLRMRTGLVPLAQLDRAARIEAAESLSDAVGAAVASAIARHVESALDGPTADPGAHARVEAWVRSREALSDRVN